jgi:ABC-type oligopeptide transport system ATPase subunit
MILLVDKIEKSFGARVLFSGASFQINPGERFALVGPNGAGKTTMLKIIMGIDSPDAGQVQYAKDCQVGYLEQETNLEQKDTTILAEVMAAAKALEDCGVNDVAVCGLAKRLEEVWVPDDDYPIILKRQSEGMYLLQRVRDESHRFAITYHRQQRRKGALRSALDEIPGIGESYQKRLLNHFGSVKAMREASVEDFEKVKGIGHAKAEALYTALHEQ